VRAPLDARRIHRFLQELGREARTPGRVYLTGGATSVLMGWRVSTIDLDLRFEPEEEALYQALPRLKQALEVNVELASPADFLPELPGWRERSLYIVQYGPLAFYHYDPYSQALSKIERRHSKDLQDVAHWLRSGLVEPEKLRQLFEAIAPRLYRFPAIDPGTLRRALEETLAGQRDQGASPETPAAG
jgi:hypothetical protein